jgi:hypothetical protein
VLDSLTKSYLQPSSMALDLHMACVCGEPYIHHSPTLPKLVILDCIPLSCSHIYRIAPTWFPDASIISNNHPPQAEPTPTAMSQAVVPVTATFIPPDTPLAAVRSVFLPFSPPVTSSLPSPQQRQVSASRHSCRTQAGKSSFAYSQPPGPSNAIPSRKNKKSQPPDT